MVSLLGADERLPRRRCFQDYCTEYILVISLFLSLLARLRMVPEVHDSGCSQDDNQRKATECEPIQGLL